MGAFWEHRGFVLEFCKALLKRGAVVLCKILRSPFGKRSPGSFSSLLRIRLCSTSKDKRATLLGWLFCLVEHRGFEPLTPTLPVLCAPNCANAPSFGILSDICHPVKSLERKNIKNITFIFRQVAAKRAARRRRERKIGKNTHFPRWGFMLFRPCPSCMIKEKRRGLRWRFCG